MNKFKVTKEKKVFFNGMEIDRILGLNIEIKPLENPTITLILSPDSVDIDEYLDACGMKGVENN